MDDLEMPAGKRVGPPDVPPVRVGRLTIEAIHWGRERGLGQNGGFIRAADAKTGAELWTLQVYRVDYDDDMEEDVQDVFIEAMARTSDEEVLITDERGRRFVVNVASRLVRTA